MRSSSAHSEAVARRLAALTAELEAVRQGAGLVGDGSDPLDGAWGREVSRGPAPAPGGAGGTDPEPERPPWENTRPRGRVWAEPAAVHPPAVDTSAPPARLPDVGRHAARRGGRLAEALPEAWRGRISVGPGALAVLAVLVAVGLAVAAWSMLRAQPEPVAADPAREPAPLVTAQAAAPAPGGSTALPSGTAPSAGPVVVHVAGKVQRPGIVELPAGSRVSDAVQAAGGSRPGVPLTSLNLARPLVDGEQILVGVPQPAGVAAAPVPSSGSSGSTTGAGELININTADQVALEELPEVGPVTAQAIVTWREQHGGFTSVDELLEVDGIGEKTLESMAPFVTL